MKRFFLPILLICAAADASAADQSVCCVAAGVSVNADGEHDGKKPSGDRHGHKGDFKQWMEQMKKYKKDFLTRELKLTDKQKQQFFPLYDKMEQEKWKIEREVREMERSVNKKGSEATDLELEKAADAAVELQGRQNEIECRYHSEFKKILSPRQMFDLNKAERKFHKSLMEHRGKQKK